MGETVSWNSGPGVLGGFRTEGGGVGEMRSSRHSLWVFEEGGGVDKTEVVMPDA